MTNKTKEQKISSFQLWKKFTDNKNSTKMHPNNVFSGFKAGYRRALKDLKEKSK